MKSIKEYISEGFYKNVGSDVDQIIKDWLLAKYCNVGWTTIDNKRRERITNNFTDFVKDHKICKMPLQKLLDGGIFTLNVDNSDIEFGGGEFPKVIKFDSNLYRVSVHSDIITSIYGVPAANSEFDIIECHKLKDLEGLPNMKTLPQLYIQNCDNLMTIAGTEGIRKLNTLYIDDCPSIKSIDALSNCKVSGDARHTGEIRLSWCPKLDVTTGIISKLIKGSKYMTIGLDRRMLEDLRDAGMTHEFDGTVDNIMYFNIYNVGDPSDIEDLLEEMIPWDKTGPIRLYGCNRDTTIHIHDRAIRAMNY